MKRTDRFLIGIVAGIIVLVGAGFAVMLLRREPDYLPDDNPAGVVNNYLLAIQRDDYERAYAYLDPRLAGYPATVAEFARNVNNDFYGGERAVNLEVTETREWGTQQATVSIRQTVFYGGGGLFDSGSYTSSFEVELVRRDGQWRIADADSYWAWCFTEAEGC